jgi:PPOX class probable F420-dependent enzyme
MPMTKREIAQFLTEPNVAVVAVTAPDGAPHAVPTWFEYRRGEAFFVTEATAYKYRCLQHDPRVTLCIDTRKPPDYKAVILKGRVTMEEKIADALMERMAVAYMEAGRPRIRLTIQRSKRRGSALQTRSRDFVGLREG